MTDKIDKGMGIGDLLTVVVPVKNEEANLAICLDRLAVLRHVVVVDSGSTDGTQSIATRYNREVVQFKWNGEFPKKRNWVLRNYRFKTPWVMFLDADERLTDAFVDEITELLPVTNCDAFICYYDNWFMGRMLRHGDTMRKTAVLRVGAGEYERIDEHDWSKLDMEIHEHIQVRGSIGVVHAHLEHHDRRSLESYYAKHEEYAHWEASRFISLMKHGDAGLTLRQRIKYALVTYWWFGLAYFCASYFVKLGFMDGHPGYVFAKGKQRYFASIRKNILNLTTHR